MGLKVAGIDWLMRLNVFSDFVPQSAKLNGNDLYDLVKGVMVRLSRLKIAIF
jgi:hypothetical protein